MIARLRAEARFLSRNSGRDATARPKEDGHEGRLGVYSVEKLLNDAAFSGS